MEPRCVKFFLLPLTVCFPRIKLSLFSFSMGNPESISNNGLPLAFFEIVVKIWTPCLSQRIGLTSSIVEQILKLEGNAVTKMASIIPTIYNGTTSTRVWFISGDHQMYQIEYPGYSETHQIPVINKDNIHIQNVPSPYQYPNTLIAATCWNVWTNTSFKIDSSTDYYSTNEETGERIQVFSFHSPKSTPLYKLIIYSSFILGPRTSTEIGPNMIMVGGCLLLMQCRWVGVYGI